METDVATIKSDGGQLSLSGIFPHFSHGKANSGCKFLGSDESVSDRADANAALTIRALVFPFRLASISRARAKWFGTRNASRIIFDLVVIHNRNLCRRICGWTSYAFFGVCLFHRKDLLVSGLKRSKSGQVALTVRAEVAQRQ